MVMARVGLVVVTAMLLGPSQLVAQAPPVDTTGDLKAIRQSLDQIVVVLRQLVQQSAQRDVIGAMTERIAAAERRLAPVEQELRTVRQRRADEETALSDLQKGLGSMSEMEKLDTTGSASAAIEAERNRMNGAITQKTALIAQLTQDLAGLEADLTQRRETIARMDAQLERLFSGK